MSNALRLRRLHGIPGVWPSLNIQWFAGECVLPNNGQARHVHYDTSLCYYRTILSKYYLLISSPNICYWYIELKSVERIDVGVYGIHIGPGLFAYILIIYLYTRIPGHVQPVGRPCGTWIHYAMRDVKDMGQQMGYRSLEWNWPKEAMNRPIWASIVDGAKLF